MRRKVPRVQTILKKGIVDDEGRHWLYAGFHNDDWETWYVYFKGAEPLVIGEIVYLPEHTVTIDRLFHHRGFKVLVSSERQ